MSRVRQHPASKQLCADCHLPHVRLIKDLNTAHLADSLQCELRHEVDNVGFAEKLVLELLHCHGEGSGEEHDLPISR